jgi:uncharacterized ferredoxin-like protein
MAKPMIEEVYAKNKQFRLVDVEEIPDDKIVVIVGSRSTTSASFFCGIMQNLCVAYNDESKF